MNTDAPLLEDVFGGTEVDAGCAVAGDRRKWD
jgi:hypothetical protein